MSRASNNLPASALALASARGLLDSTTAGTLIAGCELPVAATRVVAGSLPEALAPPGFATTPGRAVGVCVTSASASSGDATGVEPTAGVVDVTIGDTPLAGAAAAASARFWRWFL